MMVWMPPPGVIATYRHADGSVAKE